MKEIKEMDIRAFQERRIFLDSSMLLKDCTSN